MNREPKRYTVYRYKSHSDSRFIYSLDDWKYKNTTIGFSVTNLPKNPIKHLCKSSYSRYMSYHLYTSTTHISERMSVVFETDSRKELLDFWKNLLVLQELEQ